MATVSQLASLPVAFFKECLSVHFSRRMQSGRRGQLSDERTVRLCGRAQLIRLRLFQWIPYGLQCFTSKHSLQKSLRVQTVNVYHA